MKTLRTNGATGRGPTTLRLAGAAAGLAGLLCGAGAAIGQDALGSGHSLDNNLRQGSGGYNSYGLESRLPAIVEYNNALVTGNVAGGFSFRESVGYLATDDFRGALGSNDTFSFVRDSYYSAAPLAGLRGLEALREQAIYGVDETYYNDGLLPVLLRAGAGSSETQMQDALQSEYAGRVGTFIDPFRLRPRSLRSSSDRLVNDNLAARPVAYYTPEGSTQSQLISASPLRGVVTEPTLTDELLMQLGVDSAAPDAISDMVFGGATNAPLGGQEGYEEMIKRVKREFIESRQPKEDAATPGQDQGQPGAPDASQPDAIEEHLNRLRRVLLGVNPEENEGANAPTPEVESVPPPDIAREVRRLGAGVTQEKVDRLYPPVSPGRDLYSENVRAGQRLLAERRRFDAEERFSSALSLRPTEPMAAIGRVHAQIGAGLFQSAGVNLDRLLRTNPELISARYEEVLLPRDQRLRAIEQRLRVNMRRDTDMGRSSALLLAYLGWQYGEKETIDDGLAAMARIDAARGADRDPLLIALVAAWLPK